MRIEEIRFMLVDPDSDRAHSDKLRAYVTITLAGELGYVVVHDLRVIAGRNPQGEEKLFVAMPSRKIMDYCPSCGGKNVIQAAHCNWCGEDLDFVVPKDDFGREKLHTDVVHPIDKATRDSLREQILLAYEQELERQRHNPQAA